MPEEKTRKATRNPLGRIEKLEIEKTRVVGGREKLVKVTVFDARKRYTKTDGTKGQKFKRCATHGEAMTALVNFQTDIANEFAAASERAVEAAKPVVHTFFELTDYFEEKYVIAPVIIENRQVIGYRSSTDSIKTEISRFKEFFGDIPLPEMTYEKLSDYAIHLAVTPIKYKYASKLRKPSSNNKKLSLLRRILTVGVQKQWLPVNPFKLGASVIDKKAETGRERVLSFDEEMRLLAACEGEDNYEYKKKGSDKLIKVTLKDNPRTHLKLIVIFAIESGMRRREIFTTTFEQIDFDQKILFLNAAQTKALKARFIPISARMETELGILFADNNFSAGDLIFGGIKNVGRSLKTACRRAKIENLRFHDLRHTAATWMAEAGVSQAARMNIVGHSSERIHQTYTNVNADVLASTRGKMNEFRQRLEQKRKEEEEKKKAAA